MTQTGDDSIAWRVLFDWAEFSTLCVCVKNGPRHAANCEKQAPQKPYYDVLLSTGGLMHRAMPSKSTHFDLQAEGCSCIALSSSASAGR